jgi:uncharacterized protein YjbI with pentapeptide repeats
MASKIKTWRQKIQHHPFIAMDITVLLIACIAFVLAVRWLGWGWTGLTGYSPPTPQYQRGKTLWDWLQLLVIPLMLAIGGFWLNQIQKDREQRAINERAEREKRETEQRAKTEQEIAEKRDKTEREIAADNQREAAFQAYLDKMSELLLNEHLGCELTLKGELTPKEEEVRKIARVRTLTVLRRLDGIRKASVLQFLQESGLIHKNERIIDLSGADLSRANFYRGFNPDKSGEFIGGDADLTAVIARSYLNKTDLSNADLSGTNLSEANLSFSNFGGANFRSADLSNANLHKSNLNHADLSYAILFRADLSHTDLNHADLSNALLCRVNFGAANLTGTNLKDADLRDADLSGVTSTTIEALEKQARSLKGATMPDGSKHP